MAQKYQARRFAKRKTVPKTFSWGYSDPWPTHPKWRSEELFDALNFAAFYLHEALADAPNGRVLPLGRGLFDVCDKKHMGDFV